jgi:hypothetical protein
MVLTHENEEGGPFGGPGSFWIYASDHAVSGLTCRKLGMVTFDPSSYCLLSHVVV